MPVVPGPLTLVYPQWIPGEHAPTGPIDDLAGLVFTAQGRTLAWRRDDINMYAIHLDVPAGAQMLDIKLDFLATAPPTGFSAGASTSANLAVLSWNEVLLYPSGAAASTVIFQPAVTLATGWHFGTALTRASEDANTVQFRPVPLNVLIDSPLLAGRFFKEIPLAPEITPKHYLDLAADAPEDLEISAPQLAGFENLVRETGPLYASRHYESYHFLVTLSDSVAHFGLEHHQSSDDRVDARTFLDDDLSLLTGDLLPHEFTHSWNGKYRRPEGLVTSDYQHPMRGELLWVYEGLTQYFGDVLAARSGIWTADQYRAYLADSAAQLDHRPGRTWRDLEDTAVATQLLFDATEPWDNWRRGVDYYAEGELIWLEVDTTIRKRSKGKRSLNDFCARFLGMGGNTPPIVVPYTFQDLVQNLNAIEAYDWATFLRDRLTSKSAHAPLGGITNGGYHIEYGAEPNEYTRAQENETRTVDAWYSLGASIGADGALGDVLIGSPAYQAGLGPGMKIFAVNGRRMADSSIEQALRDATSNAQPIELIVENQGFVKIVRIDYHGGPRYPRLIRDANTPDLLDDILKPLARHPTLKEAKAE